MTEPIFLIGVGRSGTTMLRYMLCSHPRIYVPPESDFIPRFFHRHPTRPMERDHAVEVVRGIQTYKPFWRDWRAEPLDPETFVAGLPSLMPAALLDAIYSRYARQYGAERWGDKSPIYTSSLPLLVRLFPDAKIVHIVRDGRDVTASSLEAFSGRRYFYMDAYYAARRWRERLRAGIAAGRAMPAERYIEIRYEDLTADPESHLRAICRFIGEDFDPAMLAPNVEATKHYHTFGMYTRTAEEVTTSRRGRWHTDLSPADARLAQRMTAKLLVELGYPLEDLGRAGVGEGLRSAGLHAKYDVLNAGRATLRLFGIFRPGRSLRALRPKQRGGTSGSGQPRPR